MRMNLHKALTLALSLLILCTLFPLSAVTGAALEIAPVLTLDFEDGNIGLTTGSGTSIVTDNALGGHCLKWASVGNYDAIYTTTTLKTNTDYVVSFKMRSDKTTQLQIVIQKTDWSQHKAEKVTPTTSWSDYSVVIHSDDYTNILFKFQSLNGTGISQQFWFDDVVVTEKGSEPEPEPEPEPNDPSAGNLLTNSGFETGDFTDWSRNTSTSIVSDAYSGNYAVQIRNPAQWAEALIRTVDVKADTNYEITWYSKRVSGTGAFNVIASQTVSPWTNFTKVSGQNWMNETSGNWVLNTYCVNTGDNIKMLLKFTSEVSNAGAVLLDDICVKELKEPSDDGHIRNGDFETGQTAPWATYQSSAVSAAAKYEGDYGMKLSGSGAGYGGLLTQTIQNLNIGTTYNVSMMLKVVADGVNVQVTDGSDKLATGYYATNHAGSWTEITLQFTATAATAVLNFCGSGNNAAVEAYVDNVTCLRKDGDIAFQQALKFGGASIRDEENADGTGKGLAFRFHIDAIGGAKDYENKYISSSAKILLDDKSYTLVRMGAVMTNQAAIGQSAAEFTLDAVNGTKVIDIPAVYLNKLTSDTVSFAVRILDIPDRHVGTEIYARPYFVCLQDGQEVTVYGDIRSDNYARVSDPKSSIKILSIGHSFSKDVMETYLWNMFKTGGYDEVVIGYLYIAGCPMPKHLSNIEQNAAAYEYGKNSNGTWEKKQNHTALAALQDEEWDYVTIQSSPDYIGGQTLSDYAKTEYQCITPITDWIRKNAAKTSVKVDYHMIWAFSEGCDLWSYAYHDYDQLTMYRHIIDQTKQQVVGHNAVYNIIPCATSIQNARTSFIGDHFNEPDVTQGGSDGYHLNTKYGDYTAALTWYCHYSGDEAGEMVSYKGELNAQEFAAIAEAVDNAIENPFAITASTHP